MHLTKALIAEFIGTFALIFIGAGAVVAVDPNNWVAIGLAHGFVIMVFAYAFGNESNSYVNPALTIGVVVAGEGRLSAAVPVFLAQIAGGIVGGLVLAAVYGANAPNHLGMTMINTDMTSIAGGLFLEFIGTFFLMTAVLNTALRGTAGNFAPFAIGMTVAFCIMAFGPVTGASLNPARTLGPAIGTGVYTQVLAYSIVQILGAIVAAILYRVVYARRIGDETHPEVDERQAAF
ncbi:aquaporin family protein [Fulvimarina endophytica]|uniref:Aquaporin family protein n=1 Tax=Fulvimarina endophytica TaxID=2293836 RepID=A0A371WYF2_9HYPH|nr:MIP/aquaporin family protein [Fulvimarina endophytica]RFC62011.1 aquaporin family protein [Fulvimarina endophytica]